MLPHVNLLGFLHTENQKKIFLINPITKNQKTKQKSFSGLRQFSILFHELVLGLVGLIDAKAIDVAQPMWS